jgi:hypothetical protein
MLHTFLIATLTLTSTPSGELREEPPYQVPAPRGWAKETIPLPPEFACDLKWKGTEELRFAPNWMNANGEAFFSYAILFWLPEDQTIDAKTLEHELLTYYRGLAKAVLAGKQREVDFGKFNLAVKDAPETPSKRPGGERVTAYIGELNWIEPFATVKPQVLRLDIHAWLVKKHKQQCVFICASPQPESATIWKALREIREGVTFR